MAPFQIVRVNHNNCVAANQYTTLFGAVVVYNAKKIDKKTNFIVEQATPKKSTPHLKLVSLFG